MSKFLLFAPHPKEQAPLAEQRRRSAIAFLGPRGNVEVVRDRVLEGRLRSALAAKGARAGEIPRLRGRGTSGAMTSAKPFTARWMTIRQAAVILAMSPDALRRSLERHVVRATDGGVEAVIDGVRARKFGRLWRVALSERWTLASEPLLPQTGS